MQLEVNQYKEILKKFFSIFILLILFVVSELVPQTQAEESSSLSGKWVGHSEKSPVLHTLRIESDGSFTWDTENGKLLLSGSYSEEPGILKLQFGMEETDSIKYRISLGKNKLIIKNESAEFTFSRVQQDADRP